MQAPIYQPVSSDTPKNAPTISSANGQLHKRTAPCESIHIFASQIEC